MASNAWERAQEAIARAAERDAAVITPDTAVSPFDASRTTVIPLAQAARRGGPQDPDVTQRLAHQPNGNGHGAPGRHAAPGGPDADADADADADPAGRTDRMTPPPTVRAAHPGTSPFPVSDPPVHDETPAVEARRPWWRRLFGR